MTTLNYIFVRLQWEAVGVELRATDRSSTTSISDVVSPGISTGMCWVRAPGRTLTSSVNMLKQHWRVLTLFSFSCLWRAFTIMGTCRGRETLTETEWVRKRGDHHTCFLFPVVTAQDAEGFLSQQQITEAKVPQRHLLHRNRTATRIKKSKESDFLL